MLLADEIDAWISDGSDGNCCRIIINDAYIVYSEWIEWKHQTQFRKGKKKESCKSIHNCPTWVPFHIDMLEDYSI
jgi:hypothetical protein